MPAPRTFWVNTLGCKVNSADSDRIARHLESRGLLAVARPEQAELRIVNTCSVTTSAGAQSRAAARKAIRLPMFGETANNGKVLVSGCWATSDTAAAQALPGVDGVITHQHTLESELDRYLSIWSEGVRSSFALPVLGQAKPDRARQRAYLKIQDGCDAHCTYCIIPKLRTRLWSLSPDEAVAEVRRLVNQGYQEVILTGIFLGAFGHDTALRRRQTNPGGSHLAELVSTLAREVPELPRLRLSSLEPGDLTPDLITVLASSRQVVPHFHLPLQSGSNEILNRMNRQYSASDFLKLVDDLNSAFDRPALTTDIVTGFPGEDDGHWAETLQVARAAGFIHIHAFPFSPRPGTAAARWTEEFIPNAIATARVAEIAALGEAQAFEYRKRFIGETATVIIEKSRSDAGHLHGRCERYFDIQLPDANLPTGTLVTCRIEHVAAEYTYGAIIAVPSLAVSCP